MRVGGWRSRSLRHLNPARLSPLLAFLSLSPQVLERGAEEGKRGEAEGKEQLAAPSACGGCVCSRFARAGGCVCSRFAAAFGLASLLWAAAIALASLALTCAPRPHLCSGLQCNGASPNTWLNCRGALELWEPRNDVFPDGFKFKEPLPLALHNRWISGQNNTYGIPSDA